MYDTPGKAQPDLTGCLMARELIDDFHMTCKEAAAVLTGRGYQCKSPDTARLWAAKGREEWTRVAAQDVKDAQTRRAHHYLRELARGYHSGERGQITVVEFVRESMRVEQRLSGLYGADAPRVSKVEMSGQFTGPMDPATAAAVDLPDAAPPPDRP